MTRTHLHAALSHRMGEGESCPALLRSQALWDLQTVALAVPSPAGREKVNWFELRLLLGLSIVPPLRIALEKSKQQRFVRLFQRLTAEGLAAVVVTHNPALASVARRQIVLRDGKNV